MQKSATELIALARTFAGNCWEFVEIPEIRFLPDKQGATWAFNGRIEIGFDCPYDTLAHEIFHSAFHNSPLHKTAEPWGDGFCNAFACLATDFRAGLLPRQTNKNYLLNYQVPEMLILSECNNSLAVFREKWGWWNIDASFQPKGWFDKKFGFTPGVGFTR